MPSQLHEALLVLFRNDPTLAPALLREALQLELPAYTEARVESAELTDVQPAEYRADLVVLLYEQRPVLGIVVEAQLSVDEQKRFAWPVYAVGLRARMRCPVCLLVVTPDAASAGLDESRTRLYVDLVLVSLSESVRRSLEDMNRVKYEYQSDFARKYFSEGREEGRSEGRSEGRVETLLKLLQLRFGPPSDVDVARVRAGSLDELDAWTERVLTADSIEDVLG